MFSDYLTPCNFSLIHILWDDFFFDLAFEGHLENMQKDIQITFFFLIS